MQQGGAIMSSQWVTGHGNHTKSRPVPVFCDATGITRAVAMPGVVGKSARRILRDHPRVQFVVVCIDVRSARRALKHAAESK